jgi:hypothetical protein
MTCRRGATGAPRDDPDATGLTEPPDKNGDTPDEDAADDALQVGYFLSYGMWNYLTTPFLLTYPGVQAREISPWQEDGQTWRRLHVTFPASITTHSAEQVFYFGADGLLRRLDYTTEVNAGDPVAHYTEATRPSTAWPSPPAAASTAATPAVPPAAARPPSRSISTTSPPPDPAATQRKGPRCPPSTGAAPRPQPTGGRGPAGLVT